MEATDVYIGGAYARTHESWHLPDAPGKAEDLFSSLRALAAAYGSDPCVIADIGTGVGGVPFHLQKLARQRLPGFDVRFVGYEISPEAASRASELFPELVINNRFFGPDERDYDAVMFIDVLEHLENPTEMLRLAASKAKYMFVRQPLLDNFRIFRGNQYDEQRQTLGHIAYFNCRSFANLAAATGWKPLSVQLAAPWEISGPGATAGRRARWLKRLMTRLDRETTSVALGGFHLVGVYERS